MGKESVQHDALIALEIILLIIPFLLDLQLKKIALRSIAFENGNPRIHRRIVFKERRNVVQDDEINLFVRNPESRGAVIENNSLINVSDAGDHANPERERPQGPAAPLKFKCDVHGEFTVDGWQAAKTK